MKEAIDMISGALELLRGAPAAKQYSIGIGISTHNRYEIFKKTLAEITRFLPAGAKLAVVDDASTVPVPEATFRFDKNVGIAAAKNKCFELLQDCEHIFLFDDDCWPKKEGWYLPYIESHEPHLMYIFKDFAGAAKLNDTAIVYEDDRHVAYSHPRGVMCYFHRSCLDKVGGMDPIFGRWGWEHPDLSNRIFNAGLTSYRYADVKNSHELIYSCDEHQKVTTTVGGAERTAQIARNKQIYEARYNATTFVPIGQKRNILLTSYFTGVSDPQRGKWAPKVEDLFPLIVSLHGQQLVVLHDCLDCQDTDTVKYVKVKTTVNPYFQRWISYREYLRKHMYSINKVFCIDATDVVMLRSPFGNMCADTLYTGDEFETVGCQWMTQHHKHPELQSFFEYYKDQQLLNAGLLGGDIVTVLEFTRLMADFYFTAEGDAQTKRQPNAGITDMGAFNYLAYTRFADKLNHGLQVNTEFKAFKDNPISWFKHK